MNTAVVETSDYSKFELLPFNRDVKRIKNLVDSMKQHGWISAYPMHVVKNGNGKLKIKAGHNRFEAARSLNIPVKYCLCDDTATVHELELSTVRWSIEDYLASYVRQGRAPYITLKQYRDKTGIALSLCISMLAGQSAASNNHLNLFKAGRYELGDPLNASIVSDIVLHIRNKVKSSIGTNSYFVKALSRIVYLDEFDPEVFKHKLNTFPFLLEKKPTLQTYSSLIEDIYNRQSKTRVPLAFLADEAAKRRSATNYTEPK